MRALIGSDLLRTLPAKAKDVRDTKLTGFVLRCRASGAHSYLVQLGRGRSKTIGRVGDIAPEAARLAAQVMLQAVSKNTLSLMADDPSLTLREAKTKARGSVRRSKAGRHTFGTYVRGTYGPWVRQHRKTGDETEARLLTRFAEFTDTRLADVSGFAIERWRASRHKAGVLPATTNRDLAALRGMFSKAVEWKDLRAHPMADVRDAQIDTVGSVRFLSVEEEQQLRATLTARDERRRTERARANTWRRERGYDELPEFGTYTDHLTPIVLLALHTGCRRGELLDLTWADVDLACARITIRSATAKSGKARRVPLNTEAARVLSTWRPTGFEASAYVFPGSDGARLVDLKTAFLKLILDAGIPSFRFHDLRHTFASRLVQRGVDLNRLRALLGHADTKMVLRYAHLRDEDLADAVAALVGA